MTSTKLTHGALAFLVVAAGCRQEVASNAQWGSASVAVAPIATSQILAAAATPRPIDIEIETPPPASWLTNADVAIAGVVRRPDPAHVSQVSVAGVRATCDTAGGFKALVHLPRGIASVTVLVTDTAGRVTATTASYMVGAVSPLATPVPAAALARLDASRLDLVERAVEAALDGLDWTAALQPMNPIPMPDVLGLELDIGQVSHGPWTIALAPSSAGLGVNAQVAGVAVGVVVHDPSGSLIPVSLCGTVTANALEATTTASFTPGASGAAAIALAPPSVSIQGAAWNVAGPLQGPVTQALVSLLTPYLTSRVEAALARIAAKELPGILATTLGQLQATATVRGAAFDLEADVTALDVSPAALGVSLAGNVSAPLAPGHAPAPGSLAVAGPPPALGAGREIAIAVSPDLLARATTVAWQAGALDLDLDQASWRQLGANLPALDVAGLAAAVPELASVLPSSTPLVVRLRPSLPPLLVVGSGPDLAVLELGEVHLEIWADLGGGARTQALDLTVHGAVPVDPAIANGALVFTKSAASASYRFAVAAQPLVAVDALGLQTRLSVVVDALLPSLVSSLQVPLPLVAGATPRNVAIAPGGGASDYLVIAGDL